MKGISCRNWALWLMLGFSPLTLWADPVTVEMVPFLAKTADYDPAHTPLPSLDSLKTLLTKTPPVSELRVTRVRQQLKILTGYQFADFLTVRELIANAMDSYYHGVSFAEADRKVQVRTDPETGMLIIQDQGIGMSLHDIVFYLLTPTRSKNPFVMERDQAKEGVTGRFGQGFFSIFFFLHKVGDKIVVQTQTVEGQLIFITFFLAADKTLMLTLDEDDEVKGHSGTKISITSSLLRGGSKDGTPVLAALSSSIIRPYFRYAHRSEIFLNEERINPPDTATRETIRGETSSGSYGIYGHSIDREGEGQVHITVNGILIRSIPVKGAYIYPEVVIDFPSDTELTQDRGTLDYWSEKNKIFIQNVIQRGVDKNDVRLVNTLEPLLGTSGFNLYGFKLPFSTPTVPFRKEIFDLTAIEKKPVQFLAEPIYAKSTELDPDLTGSSSKIVASTFSNPSLHKVRVISLQNKSPVFFVDDRFDIQTFPFGKRVLNSIGVVA